MSAGIESLQPIRQVDSLEGVSSHSQRVIPDSRGVFRKILDANRGMQPDIPHPIKELFTTETKRGFVRGMHYQIGDNLNFRFVTVLEGEVYDCLVDLRPSSKTYLCSQVVRLSAKNAIGLLVPPGVLHGFQALSQSRMLYATSSVWKESVDTGINPESFGFSWPIKIKGMSKRDHALPTLREVLSNQQKTSQGGG